VVKAATGYTPTAADAAYAPFHHLVKYNVAYDNMLTQCGSATNRYDTDGNGIIIDTFDNQGSSGVLYPYQTLVAYNVTYGNGGRGVEVFRSSFVTVAGNTSYNNNLDPYNNGTFRPEIQIGGGHQNTVVNNIAWALPLAGGCNYAAGDAKCNSSSEAATKPARSTPTTLVEQHLPKHAGRLSTRLSSTQTSSPALQTSAPRPTRCS